MTDSDEPICGKANITCYYHHIVVYLHLVMGSSEKHCLRWNELKENITSFWKDGKPNESLNVAMWALGTFSIGHYSLQGVL